MSKFSKVVNEDALVAYETTVAERLGAKLDSNAVSDWAKSETKPTYTAAEVGAIPSTELGNLAKKEDISSVYKLKGSVENHSALPTTNVTVGDVYNVVSGDDANMNYVWTGTEWDPLGASFSIEFLTAAEVREIVYPTTEG